MARKIARIVSIDGIRPIPGADAIEAASVGGWTVVTRKNEYSVGDRAVYFEIDAFLPQGNPAWDFLVSKSSKTVEGQVGHVLRTIRLRGQLSQGLLLGLSVLDNTGLDASALELGTDVSEALGVVKYEAPIPAALSGVALGAYPSRIPRTDQERVQNLAEQLANWQKAGDAGEQTWEVTEKLEGTSCTWAWLDGELHVCSRNLDLKESPDNSLWRVAREQDIETKFRTHTPQRNLGLQGELIGNGIEGNIYGLRGHAFKLYNIYDVDRGAYLEPQERQALCDLLGLEHSPVLETKFVLDSQVTMQTLLAMSTGVSVLRAGQLREGLVYKSNNSQESFKVVSDEYLLGQKP